MSMTVSERQGVLTAIQEGKLTVEEGMAMLDADNQPAVKRGLSLKVSPKGCLSLYGTRWRGIHLYAEEWQKIGEFFPDILAFIEANRDKLTFKTPPGEAEKGATVEAPPATDAVPAKDTEAA